MITEHAQSVDNLMDAIKNLKETIKMMPDGKAKWQMEVRLENMQETAKTLRKQAYGIYDGILGFAVAAAR